MEELELFFLDKIKPYEERIRKLEEGECQKDYEITTLKHAIHNLNHIIEDIKSKQGAASTKPLATKPATTAKTGTPTASITTTTNKIAARPATSHAAPKTEATKPGQPKKDTKPANTKKAAYTVRPEAPEEEDEVETDKKDTKPVDTKKGKIIQKEFVYRKLEERKHIEVFKMMGCDDYFCKIPGSEEIFLYDELPEDVKNKYS